MVNNAYWCLDNLVTALQLNPRSFFNEQVSCTFSLVPIWPIMLKCYYENFHMKTWNYTQTIHQCQYCLLWLASALQDLKVFTSYAFNLRYTRLNLGPSAYRADTEPLGYHSSAFPLKWLTTYGTTSVHHTWFLQTQINFLDSRMFGG